MLLALLGVALILAAFRVDVPMLTGGSPTTWHGWVHGIAFLLIIAIGVLAPLTMAVAVPGDAGWRPIAVASRGGWRALRCFLAFALGQRHILDGDRHAFRLHCGDCGSPSGARTVTARSTSDIASQPSLSPGRIRPDSQARTTACTRLRRSSFAKILLTWV